MLQFTSIGYRNLVADFYWLQAIQYIGENAIHSEYKKYLFVILDLITELNPYFESPYVIGQLLLPGYNERYEEKTDEEQKRNVEQGEKLWLKWVENFCDPEKVKKIFREDSLKKIWKNPEFKNPCKTYKLPYYLAYIYFFYLNEPLKAANYYKVVSAQEDAPKGARTLAAIMQGKSGDREKSLYMFLNLAESVELENSSCKLMSQELQKIYTGLSTWQLQLTGNLVKGIEDTRKKIFPEFNEEIEEQVLGDTKCLNFLNKAIREINLFYIQNGNAELQKNHPSWLPARHALGLLESWYIDFLPTDYQQYEDYGIIYIYDYKNKRYDYEMGNYD